MRNLRYFILLCVLLSCDRKADTKEPSNLKDTKKLNLKKEVIKSIDTFQVLNNNSKKSHSHNISIDRFPLEMFMQFYIVDFEYNDNMYDEMTSIPIILRNNELFFTSNQYPEKLVLKLIPNPIDTLKVVTGVGNCSNCLTIMAIETNKESYFEIKHKQQIIKRGNIDNILKKRDLSKRDLFKNDFEISILDNWKNTKNLTETINQSYILPYDLNWKKTTTVKKINDKIGTISNNHQTIDSLKSIYSNNIIENKGLKFDNLLTEKLNGYSHSGGFINQMQTNQVIPIDSINIHYISENNKLYTVKWIDDYFEFIGKDGEPFDDNYVEKINKSFKINKWDNNSMINLFHKDMKLGKYLIIYEVKLKYSNIYIQSKVKEVNYR